jgi:hypothetical protein
MDGDVFPSTALGRDVFIQQYKDVGRSLDYLESRPDIDRARIGYKEMFHMLGTRDTDKNLAEFATGHAVGDRRADMVSKVTAWFDKNLGRVN